MSHPTFSIVVPAFNAATYIRETLLSVVAQTCSDWELVVVDDGSTDGTAEMASGIENPRIRIVTIPHSGLPAVARNVGIAETTGEVVAFLDADDLWRPEKLERQLEVFVADSDIGLVHTEADVIVGGQVRQQPPWDAPPPDEVFRRLADVRYRITNSSVAVRREALERYGTFATDPRLRATEDYELWLRLAAEVRFECIHEPLTLYRVHESNISRDMDKIRIGTLLGLEMARARRPDLFESLGPHHYRWTSVARCLEGDAAGARRDAARAIRMDPGNLQAWKWLAAASAGPRLRRRILERRARRLARQPRMR